MIIGIGSDIVNIERIKQTEQFLSGFARRILGKQEHLAWQENKPSDLKKQACALAKHYAAKEAFAKALGTGFRSGIFLQDIQLTHNSLGKPELKISGEAEKHLHKLAFHPQLHISLSDDYPWAQATVIIEQYND